MIRYYRRTFVFILGGPGNDAILQMASLGQILRYAKHDSGDRWRRGGGGWRSVGNGIGLGSYVVTLYLGIVNILRSKYRSTRTLGGRGVAGSAFLSSPSALLDDQSDSIKSLPFSTLALDDCHIPFGCHDGPSASPTTLHFSLLSINFPTTTWPTHSLHF